MEANMGIFGDIMGKIFGRTEAAPAPGTEAPAGTGSAGRQTTAGTSPSAGAPRSTGTSPPPGASPSALPQGSVDVEAVLKDMASKNKQNLDWRHSIVDLMKLLNLDSSLTARKELAQELGYTGALTGSADMNTWLHKQVMRKLAENGGKVPEDLKS
jgi:hypothetical protein